MKRFAARLLPVLLLFTSAALATSSRQDETDGTAKTMVNRFVESWNGADGGAYGENYWPDAELVDPSGVVLTGRDQHAAVVLLDEAHGRLNQLARLPTYRLKHRHLAPGGKLLTDRVVRHEPRSSVTSCG